MTAWRDKQTLIEMVRGLRGENLTWRQVGAVIGISHTHARRVWNLFVRDSMAQ